MKKFLRVFYSQIFNSFFPILLVAILISIKDKTNIAQIFLLLNFANVYLLFSDYSSNIHFLKEAMVVGGVQEKPHHSIIENINSYIGIKTIILSVGFIVWIILCFCIPLLHKNVFSSILSYSFIVGYNLNYYWIYISSKKEYFFIISNFISRIFFLLILLFFIWLKYDFFFLMPIIGICSIIIAWLFFKRFCSIYKIKTSFSFKNIGDSGKIIKRDLPLMSNTFLLMTPSNYLSIFIGYVKQTEHIIIYALAEKIFLAFRALLAVFINSIYPVFCGNRKMEKNKKRNIFILFYTAILLICVSIYFISPYLFPYFHLPKTQNGIFYQCLFYFLITIIVISINVPFFLWQLLHNEINSKKTFLYLLVSAVLITTCFITETVFNNGVIAIAQSVLIAESIIVVAFILLYNKKHNVHT